MTERGFVDFAKSFLATLIAILVSSCSLFSPATNDIQIALINKLPRELPQREPHAATLLVLPPAINPVYDTVRMAYQLQPHEINYFSRNEWGASPAQMLHPLLILSLEKTRYFDAVVSPPYFGPYHYALRTEILELVQDFTTNPATLNLSLRVQLSDGASSRIISSKAISLTEPLLQQTPYAGVEAANDASAEAIQQIAEFVLETLP